MTKLPGLSWGTALRRLLILLAVTVFAAQADSAMAQGATGSHRCDSVNAPDEYLDTGDTTSGRLTSGIQLSDASTGACTSGAGDPSVLAAVDAELVYDTATDSFETRLDVYYEGDLLQTITGCGTGGTAGQMLNSSDAVCEVAVATGDGTRITAYVDFTAVVVPDDIGTIDRVSAAIGWFTLSLETSTPPETWLSGDLNDLNTNPEAYVGVYFPSPVTGFEASDVQLQNLDIKEMGGSGTAYYFVLSASGDGPVSFQVPAGVAASGGAANLASDLLTATVQKFPPSVLSVTGNPMDALTGGTGTYTAEITFSEPVTLGSGTPVSVSNADIASLQEGAGCTSGALCSLWQATLTVSEAALFDHELVINEASFEDAVDTAGTGTFRFSPTPQGSAPQVTVAGLPAQVNGASTAALTFDWDQDVIGFTTSDIQVVGGSLTDFSGGPRQWTATLSIDGSSEVSLQIPAGAVRGEGGMQNLAAEETATLNSAQIASDQIRRFMEQRARALLASQPRLRDLLGDTAPSGALAFREGSGQMTLHSGGGRPLWLSLKGQWSRTDNSELSYALLTLGAHHRISEDLLVGAMVQIDRASASQQVARLEGTGWLAGPYFAARLAGGQLILDGRLLRGESRNSITPLGTFTDSFSTERWLATLSLSGEIEKGDITLQPYLEHGWTRDSQQAYRDSLGQLVPKQTVSLRETALGLDVQVDLARDLTVTAGLAAIASEGSGDVGKSARGRVSLGGRKIWANGMTLDVGSFYDGLWDGDYESFGLDVTLAIAF